MSNRYDILSFLPALKKEELYIELEKLAQELVKSGQMRIGNFSRRNFVNFRIPQDGFSYFFSRRQLYNKSLLPDTMKIFTDAVRKSSVRDESKSVEEEAEDRLTLVRYDLRKSLPIETETEEKIARMLVQAAHPVVIKLILLEKVPIFISFDQSVSELLDIREWEGSRHAGGLQSTKMNEAAIRVSAGGDPFLPEDQKYNEWDGVNAQKRLMVIAAQEIGHYADIIRDGRGNYVGRHSVETFTLARKRVDEMRRRDMHHIHELSETLNALKLPKLIRREATIQFNRKYKKGNAINKLMYRSEKQRFINHALAKKVAFIDEFPVKLYHSDWLGQNIQHALEDMLFNLEPKASFYMRDSEQETTAQMCLEALARVPQQTVKWGHDVVKNTCPNLYSLYYREVIADCQRAYEAYSGKPYKLEFTPYKETILKKLFG